MKWAFLALFILSKEIFHYSKINKKLSPEIFFIEFSDKLSNQNLFLRFLKRFKSECVMPEITFRNAFLGFIWHTDTLCIYCKLFLVKLKNQPENVIIPWLGKKLCIVKSCALALLWNDLIMRVKSRNCIKLHH